MSSYDNWKTSEPCHTWICAWCGHYGAGTVHGPDHEHYPMHRDCAEECWKSEQEDTATPVPMDKDEETGDDFGVTEYLGRDATTRKLTTEWKSVEEESK